MATSTMAINTGTIEDFADETVNDPDDLDTNFDEIVSKFNAMLETVSGHNHDAANSRLAAFGGSGFSSADMFKIMVGGGLS